MSHPLQGYKVIAELYNKDVVKGTLHKVTNDVLWLVRDDNGDLIDIPKNIMLRYFIVFDGDGSEKVDTVRKHELRLIGADNVDA